MRERKWYNDNRVRLSKGLPEKRSGTLPTLEELRETEWSPEFESLMRNRLALGAIRYGRIHADNKPIYDRVGSTIKRLIKFKETGNKEFLVDAANLCLLEFEECNHPNQHFNSIDDGEHVGIINSK